MSNFDLSSLGEDFTQYERTVGSGSSSPLPIGFYSGVITRADMKDTKPDQQGNPTYGKYLEIEFDITSPPEHGNRKFWDKFNVVNKNQTAVKIAKEQLGDLLKALGFTTSPNTEQLIGHEVCMYLAIEPARGNFKESNKCLKYLPIGSTEEDYQSWYASKKGAAKAAVGTVPERKTWGAPAATPTPAVASSTPKPAVASWKKPKQ